MCSSQRASSFSFSLRALAAAGVSPPLMVARKGSRGKVPASTSSFSGVSFSGVAVTLAVAAVATLCVLLRRTFVAGHAADLPDVPLLMDITRRRVEVQNGDFDPQRIAAARQPLLMRGSQVGTWPCFANGSWEARHLYERLEGIRPKGVSVQPGHWEHVNYDDAKVGLPDVLREMQPDLFDPRVSDPLVRDDVFGDGPAFGYASSVLEAPLSPSLRGSERHAVREGARPPAAKHVLWLGQAGLTARAHYDEDHNFLTQVRDGF